MKNHYHLAIETPRGNLVEVREPRGQPLMFVVANHF